MPAESRATRGSSSGPGTTRRCYEHRVEAVVTGATGMVGRRLVAALHAPRVLSRSLDRAARLLPGAQPFEWAGRGPAPREAFAGADVVFHLAGEPIASGKWTAERKARIRDSRVLGTRGLVAGLAELERPPRVLVSASAIGFYGDRGDQELDETSEAGDGFLAEVCRDWEREARVAEKLGVRVVMARLGLVLAPEGGALARMLPPFRLGVGGKLGNGRQWMSWIHLDDVVALLLLAARQERIAGAFNVTAPAPRTNAGFTRELARACSRPALFAVPQFGLKLAFGELSDALLHSQRVLPRVAERHGYEFAYPDLFAALEACLATPTDAGRTE